MDQSGLGIAFEAVAPGTIEKAVPEKFLGAMQHARTLPKTVRVQNERALDLLAPICHQLKITVQQAPRLQSVDDLLAHFQEFLSR